MDTNEIADFDANEIRCRIIKKIIEIDDKDLVEMHNSLYPSGSDIKEVEGGYSFRLRHFHPSINSVCDAGNGAFDAFHISEVTCYDCINNFYNGPVHLDDGADVGKALCRADMKKGGFLSKEIKDVTCELCVVDELITAISIVLDKPRNR